MRPSRIAERFKGPKPALHLTVRCVGRGGEGLDFTARVSEIANRVPAIGVYVVAELEGITDPVFASAPPPFNLGPAELDRSVRFKLGRKHGIGVHDLNHHATLYGRN
jgi:hypothetical protein